MYKWNGGEVYDKIIESGKYWAYDKEISMLDKYKRELQSYITKYFTDIWCGNGQKAVHILQGTYKKISYIASDYSASMIDIAEKNIIEQLPNIKLGNHQIMRPGNELFTNSLDENTYFRAGCTIGNFLNTQEISNQIKNMSNSGTLKGNRIIFSYFDIPKTNKEIEQTKQLYDNQEGKNFIFNGLQNIGIDTNKFNHVVEYNKQDNCIYSWIQANEDVDIFLSWKENKIKKGEVYYIVKSRRFSLDEILSILKQSGAKLEKRISEGGISLVVAKKDPKYFHKTMKIVTYTSLILAWTLLSGIGWYQLSQHKQKKEIEQKNQMLLKKNLEDKHSQKAYFDARERIGDAWSLWLELRIHQATEDFYDSFIQIYGLWRAEQKDLDVLKKFMKQYFLQADSNGVLINIDKIYAPFIVPEKLHATLQEFVWEYSQFLVELGYNIIPHAQMQKHIDACMYTQELKWNIVVNYSSSLPNLSIESDSTKYQTDFDSMIAELKEKWFRMNLPIHTLAYNRYGHYLHSNGKQYDVLIVQWDDNKWFLLAYEWEYGEQKFNPKQNHVYTKSNGEIVAKDFLGHRSIGM